MADHAASPVHHTSPLTDLCCGLFFVQLVQKFSKCPAVIEAEKGGKLQMFDGCVSGEYAELVKSSYFTLQKCGMVERVCVFAVFSELRSSPCF